MQLTAEERNHIHTTQSLLLFYEQVEPEAKEELLSEVAFLPILAQIATAGTATGMVGANTFNPITGASYALTWIAKKAAEGLAWAAGSAAEGMWKGSGAEDTLKEIEEYFKKKAKELSDWSDKKKEEWGTPDDDETRETTPEEQACAGKGDLVGNIGSCKHGQKINPKTCKCEAHGLAGYWHAFRRWFKDFIKNLLTLVQTLWAKIQQMYKVILAAATTGAVAAWDWLKKNAPEAWEWLKGAGAKAAELAKKGVESIRAGLETVLGWLKKLVGAIKEFFASDTAKADPKETPAAKTTKKKTPSPVTPGGCQPGYVKASELDRLWQRHAPSSVPGVQDIPGSGAPFVYHLQKDKCIKCDHADVISKVRILIRMARNAKKTPDRSDEDFFGKDLSPEERISQDDLICLGSLWNSGFEYKTVSSRIFAKMAEELPIDAYTKTGVAEVIRANSRGAESLVGDIFKNAPWWKFSNLHPSWREWLRENKNKKKKADKIIYESNKLPIIRKRYDIVNEIAMKKLAGV